MITNLILGPQTTASFKPLVWRLLLFLFHGLAAYRENRGCHTSVPLMPWNLWTHLRLYCPFLYSKAWRILSPSVPPSWFRWNMLLSLLLKQKSLNSLSPVSFCFICSFHFQINFWKQAPILPVFILLPLTLQATPDWLGTSLLLKNHSR